MKSLISLKSLNKVAKILKPPPKLTLSEWADLYRMLSSEASAETGKWVTARAPYQKEIMDAVSDRETKKVIVMSSSQVGKTEIILNIIGYYIDYMPCPMMLVMPIEEMLKSFSKDRLSPMINATPTIRRKVFDSKSKDTNNTITYKKFHGGHLTLVGANSAANLASRPIRVLLADEVDRFPRDVGGEGDPLKLAEKRTTAFLNRKLVYVSTPTIAGVSRIEKEFNNSTKEEWSLRCPACKEYQILKFALLDFETLEMTCEHCGTMHSEKKWKAQKGNWIKTNEGYEGKTRGFHLNEMTSPWRSWEEIRDDFLIAKNDPELLKTFINTSLGEVWEDRGDNTDETGLLERREKYDCEVPHDVLLLTAGVDTQDDRLEIEVVGWGLGQESWGIEYKVFYGNPGQENIWKDLEDYLGKTFHYEDGTGITISCTCVDSGGHYTDEVYKFIKKNEFRRWFAIKGKGGTGYPLVGKPSKKNKAGINLFSLGVDTGKESIYARLTIEESGQKYCHFPLEEEKGYDKKYFKSLFSEKRVIQDNGKIVWKKIRKNNEALDCRNYAMAAFDILKPQLEKLAQRPRGDHYQVKRASPKKKRRILSRGVSV